MADFDAIIGLGSNVGDKLHHIEAAIRLLNAHREVRIVRRSGNYRTRPWGMRDQDWFVNACVAVSTAFEPLDLLRHCQSIEEQLGRVRGAKWGPRVIDLDLLVYVDQNQTSDELTLPHPWITKRAFVLVPLNEIAPDLELAGKTVAAWLDEIAHEDVTAIP